MLETLSDTECSGIVLFSGLVVVGTVVSLPGEGGNVCTEDVLTVSVCTGTAVVVAVGTSVISAVRFSGDGPGVVAGEGVCVALGAGVVLTSRTAVVAVVVEATSPPVVLTLTSAGEEVLFSADTLVDPSASASASHASRDRWSARSNLDAADVMAEGVTWGHVLRSCRASQTPRLPQGI